MNKMFDVLMDRAVISARITMDWFFEQVDNLQQTIVDLKNSREKK